MMEEEGEELADEESDTVDGSSNGKDGVRCEPSSSFPSAPSSCSVNATCAAGVDDCFTGTVGQLDSSFSSLAPEVAALDMAEGQISTNGDEGTRSSRLQRKVWAKIEVLATKKHFKDSQFVGISVA